MFLFLDSAFMTGEQAQLLHLTCGHVRLDINKMQFQNCKQSPKKGNAVKFILVFRLERV